VQRYLVTEIQGYASAQGYDLVLGEGVFFAKGPLDITANVLAVLATKPASLPAAPPSSLQGKPAAPSPGKTPAANSVHQPVALESGAQVQENTA